MTNLKIACITLLMTISTLSYCQNIKDDVRCYNRKQREAIANKILTLENIIEVDSVNLAACDSTCNEMRKTVSIMQAKMTTIQLQATYCDTLASYYKTNLLYWHEEYNKSDAKLQKYQKWSPYVVGGAGLLGLLLGVLIAK